MTVIADALHFCGTSCRYHAVLYPITSFVCEMLPEKVRESTPRELFFEDLDRLAPEDVARICEWLTEKVDSFSAKIKPEAKEVEEEVRLYIDYNGLLAWRAHGFRAL